MSSTSNRFRTRLVTPPTKVVREWHLIDAKGKILGRVAVSVAQALSGRRKTNWSPQQDVGDHVVVINTAHVRLSSDKATRKLYWSHSGYLGHITSETFAHLLARQPSEVVRRAVYGMLPHTRQRAGMLRRLHLYPGAEHPYAAKLAR